MNANRSVPPCSVIPQVSYPDVREGAEWLRKAFGFQVRLRIANHRIQMRFGGGDLVVVERLPDDTRRSSIMLRVDDADATCVRAVEAGGKLVRPPETFPYGERQAHIEDLAGNEWKLTESVADVDPTEFGFEPGPAYETHS